MRYLLDTSALLAHYRQEAGWEQVQALFEQEGAELYLCALSLTEFGRRLYELGAAPVDVEEVLRDYGALFEELVMVDEQVARRALEITRRASGRLPLIDSLIAAAAAEREAVLVHRDHHLRVVPPEVLQGLDLTPTP
jgi:predicted nucleic acid-binding protein